MQYANSELQLWSSETTLTCGHWTLSTRNRGLNSSTNPSSSMTSINVDTTTAESAVKGVEQGIIDDRHGASLSQCKVYELEDQYLSQRVVDSAHFGVAVCGGGIRACCQGLGALGFLRDKGLLHQISFVSGVSGGGYCCTGWMRYTRPHYTTGKLTATCLVAGSTLKSRSDEQHALQPRCRILFGV